MTRGIAQDRRWNTPRRAAAQNLTAAWRGAGRTEAQAEPGRFPGKAAPGF